MTIIEALTRCRDEGIRVRPVCWRTLNSRHWVESVDTPSAPPWCFFVEHGEMEEIPHALRLSAEAEFLGTWEEVPS